MFLGVARAQPRDSQHEACYDRADQCHQADHGLAERQTKHEPTHGEHDQHENSERMAIHAGHAEQPTCHSPGAGRE